MDNLKIKFNNVLYPALKISENYYLIVMTIENICSLKCIEDTPKANELNIILSKKVDEEITIAKELNVLEPSVLKLNIPNSYSIKDNIIIINNFSFKFTNDIKILKLLENNLDLKIPLIIHLGIDTKEHISMMDILNNKLPVTNIIYIEKIIKELKEKTLFGQYELNFKYLKNAFYQYSIEEEIFKLIEKANTFCNTPRVKLNFERIKYNKKKEQNNQLFSNNLSHNIFQVFSILVRNNYDFNNLTKVSNENIDRIFNSSTEYSSQSILNISNNIINNFNIKNFVDKVSNMYNLEFKKIFLNYLILNKYSPSKIETTIKFFNDIMDIESKIGKDLLFFDNKDLEEIKVFCANEKNYYVIKINNIIKDYFSWGEKITIFLKIIKISYFLPI